MRKRKPLQSLDDNAPKLRRSQRGKRASLPTSGQEPDRDRSSIDRIVNKKLLQNMRNEKQNEKQNEEAPSVTPANNTKVEKIGRFIAELEKEENKKHEAEIAQLKGEIAHLKGGMAQLKGEMARIKQQSRRQYDKHQKDRDAKAELEEKLRETKKELRETKNELRETEKTVVKFQDIMFTMQKQFPFRKLRAADIQVGKKLRTRYKGVIYRCTVTDLSHHGKVELTYDNGEKEVCLITELLDDSYGDDKMKWGFPTESNRGDAHQ